MGSGNGWDPGTNWGARRAEQFCHLKNYTLTPGCLFSWNHNTEDKGQHTKLDVNVSTVCENAL